MNNPGSNYILFLYPTTSLLRCFSLIGFSFRKFMFVIAFINSSNSYLSFLQHQTGQILDDEFYSKQESVLVGGGVFFHVNDPTEGNRITLYLPI